MLAPKPSRTTYVVRRFVVRFARSLITSFGDRPVGRAKLDICRARRELSGAASTVSCGPRGRRWRVGLGGKTSPALLVPTCILTSPGWCYSARRIVTPRCNNLFNFSADPYPQETVEAAPESSRRALQMSNLARRTGRSPNEVMSDRARSAKTRRATYVALHGLGITLLFFFEYCLLRATLVRAPCAPNSQGFAFGGGDASAWSAISWLRGFPDPN